MLQREILYALLGHTGQLIVEDEDGNFVLARGLPLVDASERELLQRLLHLGWCYRGLEQFTIAHIRGGTEMAGGPYSLAFALGLEECLQPYRARVLHLEQQLLSNPDLSLPALQLGFGDFELSLPALRRLLETVERSQLRGVALLDHLHARAAGCVHSLRASLRVLLRHTQRVLRSQLAAWLLHGELLPGDGDFFIARRVQLPPSTPSTEEEDGTDGAHQAATATDGGSGAAQDAGGWDDDAGWFTLEVVVQRKPAALPMRVAERILFIGKTVRVLRASDQRREGLGATAEPPTGHTTAMGANAVDERHASRREVANPGGSAAPMTFAELSSSPSAPAHGVAAARAALGAAEAGLEAVELEQERAAVRELEAEAIALAMLPLLTDGPDAIGDETGADDAGRDDAYFALATKGRDGATAAGARLEAAEEMQLELRRMAAELHGLPMMDGALQLQPLERLLARMHRTATCVRPRFARRVRAHSAHTLPLRSCSHLPVLPDSSAVPPRRLPDASPTPPRPLLGTPVPARAGNCSGAISPSNADCSTCSVPSRTSSCSAAAIYSTLSSRSSDP